MDELPYQVNKKTLQERIAELVHDKKIEGISHIQDESDKSGMRLVIELKRGEVPEVVLNNLYKQTQLIFLSNNFLGFFINLFLSSELLYHHLFLTLTSP